MSHRYDEAACRGVPVSVFFPDDDQPNYALARRLCESCPVRTPCLEDAHRARVNHGMFGGLTPKERRAARRDGRGA